MPEVACQGDKGGIITTGGGFSKIYERPTWQSTQVNGYLDYVQETKMTLYPGYNRDGRGYPDISLLARNYVVTIGGNLTLVSGTSASSPVFAAFVSLVNSQRLENGMSPLGWVNPALYQLGSMFVNDVTVGDNHCVAMGSVCCSQGYSATPNWDPVTGLGSIDFGLFKSAMLSALPSPTARPSFRPGSPTPLPTKQPHGNPTHRPTQSPTMAKGFVMIEQYDKDYCEGQIMTFSGTPTNSCFQEFDESEKVIGSRRYVCTNGKCLLVSLITSI